ncbi:MAG TPA: NAD-dependent epimerase/dehydratase family protein [Longimicrobiales bacterium]|nr:NAD-dependent epimerase/dehydratase family protein [Longimicrobiales bacterium]
MSTRRNFLRTTAAAGAGAALGGAILPQATSAATVRSHSSDVAPQRASAPLDILILGGTGFTGPHQVRYAVGRGHRVTVFNRGQRQADLPDGVEHLQGDRNARDGLAALRGERRWDVVIDNPTTLPHWVRDAGEVLRDRTSQYVFISTISVYADTSRAGMDENTPLAQYQGADPLSETMESFRQNVGALYGPLKAASEREAERWFPGKTTVIRPGLIVGPGDESDRFTYWPVRVARGGTVMAPGTPADPVQIIDARDLAEWTIRMAEQRATGIYNATGPRAPLSIAEMLHGIRASQSGDNVVRFEWVPQDFLDEHEVHGWSHMPVWVPVRDDNAGFARVSIERAVEKGLTFRPLALTARDTLEWFRTLPAERQAELRAGLPAEREVEVLRAWEARKTG